MINRLLKTKKLLAIPIIIVALFFSLNTQKAYALAVSGVPVGDPTSWVTTIGEWAAGKAAAVALEAARMSMDSMAYAIGQMLLNMVTDNIVNWVKGGFNGSPSFAVDPNKLFLDMTNMVTGGMATQIRGLATCDFNSAFNYNLANAVDLSNRSGYSDKFADQIKCPFTPADVRGIYSDFGKAGWVGFESILNDNANPFGNKILTVKELSMRQKEVLDIKKQELSWANGFLSMTDTDKCSSMPVEAASAIADGTMPPAATRAYQSSYCQKTTPGKVVGDKLTQALGADMERLGFVDNINKILGAIINQLSSQAMSGIFSQSATGANTSGGPYTGIGAGQAVIINASTGSQVATIPTGATNQFANSTTCTGPSACSAFTLLLSGGTGTLTSIDLTKTGTVGNADISNFALYYNTTGNFANGRTLFGSSLNLSAVATTTISGSLALQVSTPVYFYVKFDAHSSPPGTMPTIGTTVGFKISNNNSVVVSSGATRINATGAPQSLVGVTTFQL